jgi:hypothetical protein
MAEVVARPLPAPPLPDGLPLPGELEVAIDTIARQERVVVLLARSRWTAPDLTYRWQASAGELLPVAPDVVVWTLPAASGAHQVKLAVETELAAGVATHVERCEA